MKGIITVDIGTTSMRAILYDTQARAIHTEQRENLPDYLPDGRVEQEAGAWANVLREVLAGCALAANAQSVELLCVSVTAQRSSVIPVDAAGVPLHPAIMWQDRRTAALAQALAPENRRVYDKTGLKISPVFSALKMLWLRRHRPEIWAATHKMIGIQDWVLYLLTGRFVTDETFGSRTNLLDLHTRRWDPALLALFEVEERMLCELISPGAIAGGVTALLAAETGMPCGLPVVSAGGDQQCAALGLGLFNGARAVSNTGTGSYLIGHSDQPIFDEEMRLACNVSAVPGAYIVEAAVLTSGTIYRWLSEMLGAQGAPVPFDALNAEAAAVPAGANGLVLLPHFKGAGAPYWDPSAKGCFFNLTLSTTRGEMARAILEGIAIEMNGSLALVERLCGRVESISVSGGLTRSDLFNQIQSDIFARPVIRYRNSEATSLGAWIAGSVAVGFDASYAAAFDRVVDASSAHRYQPDVVAEAGYRKQSDRAQTLYRALANPELRALFVD